MEMPSNHITRCTHTHTKPHTRTEACTTLGVTKWVPLKSLLNFACFWPLVASACWFVCPPGALSLLQQHHSRLVANRNGRRSAYRAALTHNHPTARPTATKLQKRHGAELRQRCGGRLSASELSAFAHALLRRDANGAIAYSVALGEQLSLKAPADGLASPSKCPF